MKILAPVLKQFFIIGIEHFFPELLNLMKNGEN